MSHPHPFLSQKIQKIPDHDTIPFPTHSARIGRDNNMQMAASVAERLIGCITDDRQTRSATQTCLTNTPRDAEPF